MATYEIKVNVVFPENNSLYLDLLRNDTVIADSVHFDLDDKTCDTTDDAGLLLRILFHSSNNVYDTLRFLMHNPDMRLKCSIRE